MSDDSSKSATRRVVESVGHSLWTLLSGFYMPGIVLIFLIHFGLNAHLLTRSSLAQPTWSLVLFAAQYLIGLGLLLMLPVFIQKFSKQKLRELLGITRRPVLKDLGMALSYFVIYFVLTAIVQALVKAYVPGVNLDEKQNVGFDGVSNVLGLIAAFVALIILAPVAEELIFRGYLFGRLRPLIGVVASVIITSALFGFVHGQWNVGIDVAVLSIFLCMLRVKTGSIWAGIFLHMTKNSLAYFFLFVAPLLGIQIQ